MTLRELLARYVDTSQAPVIVDNGAQQWEVLHLLNHSVADTLLARSVASVTGPDPHRDVCIWLAGSTESGPDFILHNIPRRKPGRPKERSGEYETISLEVPVEVLRSVDSLPESRREFYERVARRELGGK